MLVRFVSGSLEQIAEGRLQLKVNLGHYLRDEPFFGAEIMQQHSGTGADSSREWAQGKMSHSVAEEIGKTAVQETFACFDVTTVT